MADQRIEVHLLTCLQALLEERSVTRAANRLNMSQPGMSNALLRLRNLTRDPLLVRTSRGLELTPRAQELKALVRSGIAILDEIFCDARPFEPAHAQGVLNVSLTETLGMLIAPRLVDYFDRTAPGLSLRIRRLDQATLRDDLSEGRCDFAIGYMATTPEHMFATNLLVLSLSVLRAAAHPEIGETLSLEQYIAARHVAVSVPSSVPNWSESTVGDALRALSLRREIGATVHSILLAPDVVAGSRMLCTLPTWLARQSSQRLNTVIHPLPFDIPRFTTQLLWHQRTHSSGLHQWARAAVRDIARELGLQCPSEEGIPVIR